MIFINIFGLLGALIVCSYSQQTKDSEPMIGLRIDNGIYRGITYTDSLGSNYNLRYMPITITNDSTISIHLQIAFSKEYNYPDPASDEKFKIIPLSKEWALDGVGITESMIDELPNHIEKPFLNETIEPGEKIILAIGSLFPTPVKATGVLPRILFTHSDTGIFPECDWLTEEDPLSNQQIPLKLEITLGERCMIILCGQISYSEN